MAHADSDLVAADKAGNTEVNIATHIHSVFTVAVRGFLGAEPEVVDTLKYLGPARSAATDEAARPLQLHVSAPVPAS